MSIYEYDEEKHMRMEREEWFAKGYAEGFAEAYAEGCEKGKMKRKIEFIGKYIDIGGTVEEAKRIWELTDEEVQLLKER